MSLAKPKMIPVRSPHIVNSNMTCAICPVLPALPNITGYGLVKKIYFSEIGHFGDFIFDIIHVKVISNTNPMMYFMYHLIKQVRRYFDFPFLS